MAFIYLCDGKVLRVSATREAVTADLQRAGAGETLVYEVELFLDKAWPNRGRSLSSPRTSRRFQIDRCRTL